MARAANVGRAKKMQKAGPAWPKAKLTSVSGVLVYFVGRPWSL